MYEGWVHCARINIKRVPYARGSEQLAVAVFKMGSLIQSIHIMQEIARDRKRIIVIGLLLLVTGLAGAQPIMDSALNNKRYKNRYLVWTTPTRSKSITGIAIGVQALNSDDKKLTINGVNADFGALGFIAIPVVALLAIIDAGNEKPIDLFDDKASTIINGISVSIGGEIFVSVHGFNIAGLATHAYKLNGISISGLASVSTQFRGLVIGGIYNSARSGVGIQIGLINNCKNLKGLQIGVWNKSGKRGLPFINWGT